MNPHASTERVKHKHRRPYTCSCNIQALEPDEDCPIHGQGEWPPRCEECGCFMPWPKYDENGKQL